jgi:hypothetical protein
MPAYFIVDAALVSLPRQPRPNIGSAESLRAGPDECLGVTPDTHH